MERQSKRAREKKVRQIKDRKEAVREKCSGKQKEGQIRQRERERNRQKKR